MNNAEDTIPPEIIQLCRKLQKKDTRPAWWRVEWYHIPRYGHHVVSTKNALVKWGIEGWIIKNQPHRKAFIGPACVETYIPEYTILMENGCQYLAQMPRDFVPYEERERSI